MTMHEEQLNLKPMVWAGAIIVLVTAFIRPLSKLLMNTLDLKSPGWVIPTAYAVICGGLILWAWNRGKRRRH